MLRRKMQINLLLFQKHAKENWRALVVNKLHQNLNQPADLKRLWCKFNNLRRSKQQTNICWPYLMLYKLTNQTQPGLTTAISIRPGNGY